MQHTTFVCTWFLGGPISNVNSDCKCKCLATNIAFKKALFEPLLGMQAQSAIVNDWRKILPLEVFFCTISVQDVNCKT